MEHITVFDVIVAQARRARKASRHMQRKMGQDIAIYFPTFLKFFSNTYSLARKNRIGSRICSVSLAFLMLLGTPGLTVLAASPDDDNGTTIVVSDTNNDGETTARSTVTLKAVSNGKLSFADYPDATTLDVASQTQIAVRVSVDSGYKLSGIVAVGDGAVLSGSLYDDIFTFKANGSNVSVYAECVPMERIDEAQNQIDNLHELIVKTSDESILLTGSNIVSHYGNLYVLSYESSEDAKAAFTYYNNVAEFVDFNTAMIVQDDEYSDYGIANSGECESVAGTNELDKLNEVSGSVPQAPAKTIALIDTGVSADADVTDRVSFIEGSLNDDNGHGSAMYDIIKAEYPEVNILSIKAMNSEGIGKATTIYAAIQYAIEAKVDVINLSISAYSRVENVLLHEAIKQATDAGIVVVGAAGNMDSNAKWFLPGMYDEAIVVGASSHYEEGNNEISEGVYSSGVWCLEKHPDSNYGDTVDYFVDANSTSEASAIMSAYIAKNGTTVPTGKANTDRFHLRADLSYDEETSMDDPYIDYYEDFTTAMLWSYMNPSNAPSHITEGGGGDGDLRIWYSEFIPGASYSTFVYRQTGVTQQNGNFSRSIYCAEAAETNPFGGWDYERVGGSGWDNNLKTFCGLGPGGDAYDLMINWWRSRQDQMNDAGVKLTIPATMSKSDMNTGHKWPDQATSVDKANRFFYMVTHMCIDRAYTGDWHHLPGGKNGKFDDMVKAYYNYAKSLLNDDTDEYTDWWYRTYKCDESGYDSGSYQRILLGGVKKESTVPLVMSKTSSFGNYTQAQMNYFFGASNVNTNGNRYYGDLANAKFDAVGPTGSSLGVQTLGDDYSITWAAAKNTTYTITETSIPTGYMPSVNTQITVGAESTSVTINNVPKTSSVGIIKVFDNPAKVQGNSNYSVEGAVYELIPNWGSGTNQQAYKFTATTDANGYAQFGNVPYGQYTLHEVSASKGCACAPDKAVIVNGSGITMDRGSHYYDTGINGMPVTEITGDDPVDILLQKIDISGNIYDGNTKLSGAQFTIKFYDEMNVSDDNESSFEPIFTMVVQTVPYGNGPLGYTVDLTKNYRGTNGEYCLISWNHRDGLGIDNFYNEDEEFLFPFGSAVIRETKAPEGYINPSNLDGWDVTYFAVGSSAPITQKLTVDDTAVVIRIPAIEGVTHQQAHINAFNNAGPTITAEEMPKTVGYKVTKKDWQTNTSLGQGDATLGPITYNLYNRSESEAWVDKNQNGLVDNGEMYASGAIIDTITLNPIKDASGKVTGFETYTSPANYLAYGAYEIVEVVAGNDYEVGYNNYNTSAVEGYRRMFECDANTVNGYIFDLTSDKALIDEVVRGNLTIKKYDSQTGTTPQGDATFEGAEFEIINMSASPVYMPNSTTPIAVGDVVTTITTDANGNASTGTYVLPIGTYGVREKKAPTGYNLNTIYCVDANGNPSATGKITKKGETISFVYVATVGQTVPAGQLPGCPEDVIRGGISLYKSDIQRVQYGNITKPEDNVGQGDATLAGYHFNIINKSAHPVVVNGTTYAVGDVVMTIVTDENGFATTDIDTLPYGTYDVVEESNGAHTNSDGYFVDASWKQTVQVREHKIYPANYRLNSNGSISILSATNQIPWRGGAFFDKIDMDRSDDPAQGDATLKGAEITIYNNGKYSVRVGNKWYAPGEAVLTITTDSDGRATTGQKVLPYGHYYAVESKASTGYLVNDQWRKDFFINADGCMIDCTDSPLPEPVVRGDVQIQKYDSELGKSEATGGRNHGEYGMDLSGIKFEIYNASALDVYVDDASGIYGTGNVVSSADGTWYQKGSLVTTIVTHWNADVGAYTAETTNRTLPYGTYIIKEVGYYKYGDTRFLYGNDYYLVDDTAERVFEIRENGKTVTVDKNGKDLQWTNTPVRGDFEFEKKIQTDDDRDQSRLHTAWVVTNVATGERHAIVTSPNAEFNSSSPMQNTSNSNPGYAHTYNTNGNDWILDKFDAGEPIAIADTDYTCGVWFGLGEDGSTSTPNDKVGALPYGHYTLTEVPSDTNEEYKMISIDFYITRPSVEVDLGTLTNREEYKASITTSATLDSNDLHIGQATDNAKINDVVSYSMTGSTKGKKFIVRGQLMVRETGEFVVDKDGNVVMAESEQFTAASDDAKGNITLTYTFDATQYEGKSVVVYEYLYEVRGTREILKAKHEVLTDDNQTVRFPKIQTTALTEDTSEHEALAEGTKKFIDTVNYDALIPGEEYTLVGTFFDTSDNDELRDASGKVITQTVKFTPKKSSGSQTVEFEFDVSGLAGHTIVCFETLKYGNEVIALHADMNDKDQTISFPKIGTTAKFDTGLDMGIKSDSIVINDTVAYEGVIVGNEYGVQGRLVNTNGEEILDSTTGKPVTASTTFTATATSGTVTLTFDFDGSKLADYDIVVFEKLLTANGNVIAKHEDTTDEEQTVHFPEIQTTLTYGDTGSHEGLAAETVTLPDLITYRGLIPNEEYEVRGILMDKSSNSAVKNADGSDVTATATFKAEATSGTTTVTFTFDARAIAGRDVVAFEKLYYAGTEITSHEDIDDENQTVSFPKIETVLVEQTSGLHFALKGETVTVIDTISYTNLTPNVEYTAKGHLVDESGNAIGSEVSAKFTPTDKNGTTTVTLTLDTTAVEGGKKVVAFESVYRGEALVAVHEDLKDENQTVRVPDIQTTAHLEKNTDNNTLRVTDTIDFVGLIPGETYVVFGRLMNPETGTAYMRADGVTAVTATASFVPQTADGSTEIEFNVSDVDIDTAVVFEKLLYADVEIARHEDINDEKQTVRNPKIGTTATYSEKNINMAPSKTGLVINDTVDYKNFEIGQEYVMKGKVYDRTANELLDVTSETKFTPTEHNGSVVVTFTIDTSKRAGHTFVMYETCVIRDSSGKETVVVKHENPQDEAQTIYVPDIKTTLTDAATNTHTAAAVNTVRLNDKIDYNNLVIGKTYVATGKLIDKATGEPLKKGDAEITAQTTFTAEATSGSVIVTFEFTGVDVSGKSIVAFETLTHEGVEIAVHADVNDENQMVTFPSIHTNAIDSVTKTHQLHIVEVEPDSNASATTTSTTNYGDTLKGAGVGISSATTSVDGRTVPSEMLRGITVEIPEVMQSYGTPENTFKVTAYSMSDFIDTTHPNVTKDSDYRLTFNFLRVATGKADDKSFLAIADCYDKDGTVLKSDSINIPNAGDDFSGSVAVPVGTTKVTFRNSGTTSTSSSTTPIPTGTVSDKVIEITDTVSYTGLVKDTSYSLTGKLMDKSTGKELMDAQGNIFTSVATFKAEGAEGTTTVTFTVPGNLIVGKSIVVFEKLAVDGVVIAEHEDINDESQTVYGASISTVATGADGRSKTIARIADAKIIDAITYKNLLVGEQYKVVGQVYNKTTGKFIDSAKVESTFTPSATSATVTQTFTVDATKLGDNDVLVCYETVYDAQGNVIAIHHDMNDGQQTVTVKTTTTVQTGITTYSTQIMMVALALMMVAVMSIFGVVGYRKIKIAKAKRK